MFKQAISTLLYAVLPLSMYAASPSNGTPTDASIFTDDLRTVEMQFEGLNQLEETIEQRNASYSELLAEAHPALGYLATPKDLSNSIMNAAAAPDERLLGIPGFWWGCCFGLIGAVLCYVAIDDPVAKKREGKQAIIGFIVSTLVTLLFYVVYIALALSAV